VRSLDELPLGGDELLDRRRRILARVPMSLSHVGDDDVCHARLRQHVTVEPGGALPPAANAPSLSVRLPPIPSSSTATGVGCASSRLAR
jgi:hypothetical protein